MFQHHKVHSNMIFSVCDEQKMLTEMRFDYKLLWYDELKE